MVTRSGESTSARARYSSSSRTAPSADVEGRDALGLEQLGARRRGLGAALEPVPDALLVDHDRRRVRLRVVAADRLDEAAVTRGAPVGDDDAPHRVLLPADAGEPHGNRQRLSLSRCLWCGGKGSERNLSAGAWAATGRASCPAGAPSSGAASRRTA